MQEFGDFWCVSRLQSGELVEIDILLVKSCTVPQNEQATGEFEAPTVALTNHMFSPCKMLLLP